MLTIVGPMRSGTSIVARIANQMGIAMGTSMLMPPAGSLLDPEWEDLALAVPLFLDPKDMSVTRMYSYIRSRQATQRGLWGFKSPGLAMYWPLWIEALQRANEPMQLVVCERDLDDCTKSLRREHTIEPFLTMIEDFQARIVIGLQQIKQAHTTIYFNETPESKATKLSHLIGIQQEPQHVRGIRQGN